MRTELGHFVAVFFAALLVIAVAPAAADEARVPPTAQELTLAPGAGLTSLATACGFHAFEAAGALDFMNWLLPLESPLAQSSADSPLQSRQRSLGQRPSPLATCSGDDCGCSEGLQDCRNGCFAHCGGNLTCETRCNMGCWQESKRCSLCCCADIEWRPEYC